MSAGGVTRFGTVVRRTDRSADAQRERDLAFVFLAFVSAIVLLYAARHTYFFNDEYDVFALRSNALHSYGLTAQNGDHLELVTFLVYDLFFRLFGLGHYFPYVAMNIAMYITACSLLYLYVRRHADGVLALAAAGAMLFLGSGWESLVWAFGLTWTIPMAAGLGALLLLDRRGLRADAGACGLLTLGIAAGSFGVPAALAAGASTLYDRDARRRAWVWLIPLALYAIWRLAYAHSAAKLENVVTLPVYFARATGLGVAALTGFNRQLLAPYSRDLSTDYAAPLGLVVLALVAWRICVAPPPRLLTVGLVMGGSFFAFADLVLIPGRIPEASRYALATSLAILLVLVAIVHDIGLLAPADQAARRRRLAVLGTVLVLGALANLGALRGGVRLLDTETQRDRGMLTAVELARDHIAPTAAIADPPELGGTTSYMGGIFAGDYLKAKDDLGSLAYTERELTRRPDSARQAADRVLFSALGMNARRAPLLDPSGPAGPPGVSSFPPGIGVTPKGRCLDVTGGTNGAIQLEFAPGTLTVQRAINVTSLQMGRFGTPSIPLPLPERGTAQQVSIVPDRSPHKWLMVVTLPAGGSVQACA
jgi:hypothetical protein